MTKPRDKNYHHRSRSQDMTFRMEDKMGQHFNFHEYFPSVSHQRRFWLPRQSDFPTDHSAANRIHCPECTQTYDWSESIPRMCMWRHWDYRAFLLLMFSAIPPSGYCIVHSGVNDYTVPWVSSPWICRHYQRMVIIHIYRAGGTPSRKK